jgi:anti-anti-sigma factor
MELHLEGATVRLSGQLDGRSTAELRDVLHAQLDSSAGDVVLDLGDVDFVDLTALRMIAVASRYAALQGHRLLLRDCTPLVRRLLHLSHLRGLIAFDQTVRV